MGSDNIAVHYTLRLVKTESGTGRSEPDITTPLGVPCCKCFVVSEEGRVVKGTGAHLNARRALLAAMTETPYP